MLPQKNTKTAEVEGTRDGGQVKADRDNVAHGEGGEQGHRVQAKVEKGKLCDSVRSARKGVTAECSERTPEGGEDSVLGAIYTAVTAVQGYNFTAARVPVPSGLCVEAWRHYLEGYHDTNLPDFLAYGWPIYCQQSAVLSPTWHNHPSADRYDEDIKHYIDVEKGFGALGGLYDTQPFTYMHASPLMTRPKKDSRFRRVIMDLSWPPSASVNDAIQGDGYVDGLMTIRLPTVEYMEGRLLECGKGAYLYKTDLARGYRQLRVDPSDWPLLGFTHQGKCYFDVCPPFWLTNLGNVYAEDFGGHFLDTRPEGVHFTPVFR